MNDLYGDLPPADGETTIDLSSKMLPTVKVSDIGQISRGKAPEVVEKQAVKIDKEKPVPQKTSKSTSSLLFKPRQTSVSSSSVKTIDSIPVKSKAPSFSSETTAINQVKQSSEIHQTSIEERFNSNEVYDVPDPYDPSRPNDYLQFCEERDELLRIKRLEEESKKQFEEMERQRIQLEERKQRLVNSNDYQRLLQLNQESQQSSSLSGGRGRGRGVVNLPAWMTEQLTSNATDPQQSKSPLLKEIAFEDIATTSKVASEPSAGNKRKRTNPSKVLRFLLPSIASSKAIREECETCGPILSSQIITQEVSMVLMFIAFERQDSAVRALRLFEGKDMEVSYYDDKFYNSGRFE